MSDHKRAILTTVFILILALILIVSGIGWGARRNTLEVDKFICTAKSVVYLSPLNTTLNGTLVLDLKSDRIAVHYKVKTQGQADRLFFQDIHISKLHRMGDRTFTFKVSSVSKFSADTTNNLFSWLRLLQPGTVNELKIVRIGKSTYMFSLNRRIYNICTTSTSAVNSPG